MQRQMAWRVLATYLTVTAPAALRAPASVAICHFALLALAAALAWVGPSTPLESARWLDWGPLVAMAVLYSELPSLMRGLAGGAVAYHDATVQRWEADLFGTSPAVSLAARLPTALAGPLHAAYLSYYALIFVPPLLLYARGAGSAFRTTILALTASFAACFVVFVYFPVQGPRYVWGAPPGMPASAIRGLTLRLLRAGSSRGAAFPSSHVAVATTQAALALVYQRRVGAATAACAGLLAAGAVYGGFHYGVDVLAGAALGLLAAVAVVVYTRRPRRLLSMSDAPGAALAGAGQRATD